MPEINIDVTVQQPVTPVSVTVEQPTTNVEVVVASGSTIINALLIANRLSEFVTEEAKMEARQNIGLQNIDLGTFY